MKKKSDLYWLTGLRKKTFSDYFAVFPLLALSLTTTAVSADAFNDVLDLPSARLSDPIAPDRPDFGDSPLTVPFGHALFEGGYSYGLDNGNGRQTLPVLLARYGFYPNVELRVGYDGFNSNEGGQDGAGNTRIGLKFHTLDEDGLIPDLAIIPELSLPTGDDDVVSDEFEPEVRFAWGHSLTDAVGIGGNVNFAGRQDGNSNNRFFEWALSFVAKASLTDKLGSYVEYFGVYPDVGDSAHGLDGGLTYLLQPRLQLDASVGTTLNGEGDDFSTGFGIAYLW